MAVGFKVPALFSEALKMKIIIIGAGEVGFHLAQKLSEEGKNVVVVEKARERLKRVDEELDVQSFPGSGTSPKLLKEAGIREADMLLAATDSDEVNLISCLLAKNLNPYILKIARIRNQEYIKEKSLFSEKMLGVDQVINTESLMVESIVNLMKVPEADEIIDFVGGKVKLVGVTIPPTSPFVNRRLMDAEAAGTDILVGAVARGNKIIIPRGTDKLKAGDLVYLVVKPDNMQNIFNTFGIEETPIKRVVIVGADQGGGSLAATLDKMKISTKIIEKDADRCTSLAESLDRVIVIHGDGTDRDLLIEENIADVDILVSITGDEERNILISLLAKGLGAKRTITRINKLSYIPIISAIGISTLVSSRLCAIRAILQHIRKGKIISVAPLKGEHAEAIEAEALETSDIVNTPLSDIKFPPGVIVGAIVRGDEIIIPKGASIVMPHDHLLIFSIRDSLSKLEKLLTVKLEYF
jgi:trk system potassium uptake protein